MEKKVKTIEWKCTWCGMTKIRSIGRPDPGNCPRKGKTKDGRPKPHTWVKNRTL